MFSAFASRPRPRSLHPGPRSHPHSSRLCALSPSYTLSCSIVSVSRRCRLQEYARHFHMRLLSASPAHQDDSALSIIAPVDTPAHHRARCRICRTGWTGTFRGTFGTRKHVGFVYKTSCIVVYRQQPNPAHFPPSHFSSHFRPQIFVPALALRSQP
jgi:hypothetical protein